MAARHAYADLLLGGDEKNGAFPQLKWGLDGVVADHPLPLHHDADAGTVDGAQFELLDTDWDLCRQNGCAC